MSPRTTRAKKIAQARSGTPNPLMGACYPVTCALRDTNALSLSAYPRATRHRQRRKGDRHVTETVARGQGSTPAAHRRFERGPEPRVPGHHRVRRLFPGDEGCAVHEHRRGAGEARGPGAPARAARIQADRLSRREPRGHAEAREASTDPKAMLRFDLE